MPQSRRTRRRLERQRAERPARGRSLSLATRLSLVLGGVAVIVIGIALLVGATTQTANRLGRVAGILVILGLVSVGAGAIGRI